MFFSPLYCALPIDAPNLSTSLGKEVLTEKKAREKLTGNYRRYNIVAHCLMAQGSSLRQYIIAGNDVPSLVLRLLQKKETLQVFAVFCNRQDIAYSFCFTGAETEIHKIKDNSKISKANKPQSPRSEANSHHLPPS